MCRWLAYSGAPILLEDVLYEGPNSLVGQSLNSKLGAEPVNGDGFGVGWYGARDTPGVYRSIEPAWNDANLRELAGHITSPLFFTHIRAAIGSAVQQTNCHPFRHENWLFMHNGYINEFATIKRDLVLAVDPSLYPEIKGQADTEVLFYLALTFGLMDDPTAAVEQAIGLVEAVAERHDVPHAFQGTVATTDGESIWAFRYSSEQQIALPVLHDRRADAAQAVSRAAAIPRCLGQRAADRFRAARRRRRRLERGARVQLGGHRPRPRGDATIPSQGAGDTGSGRPVVCGRSVVGRRSSRATAPSLIDLLERDAPAPTRSTASTAGDAWLDGGAPVSVVGCWSG